MHRVQLTNSAQRIFKKLPTDIQIRLKAYAKLLEQNPQLGQQLKGKFKSYRSLHVSIKGTAYRIIYRIVNNSEIIIFLADKRENIYKRLETMGL